MDDRGFLSLRRIDLVSQIATILLMLLVMALPRLQHARFLPANVGLVFGIAAIALNIVPLVLCFISGGGEKLREYGAYYREVNGLSWRQMFLYVELPFVVLGTYCAFRLVTSPPATISVN